MSATIGSLIVDMKANTAKLDAQLKHSKSHFNSLQKTIHTVRNALIAFGAVTVLKDVLANVAANEKAFALLKSQIKATGGAAGYSATQLQAMAMQMEHASTFSHIQIEQAQSELMAFTNITGEQFKKTLQVAMDFATVTGRSLPDALRTLGVAINNPLGGMGRLTTAGVSLTKEQQNQIKAMAASGNVLEAQNTMLKDLETSYGGAADAARNTFGGALSGLKNTLGDLIDGGNGSFNGATQSVNQLAQTLQSPQIKEGINALIGSLATLVGWLAKVMSGFVEMGQGLGILMAKIQGYGGQQAPGLASLDAEILNVKRDMADLTAQMGMPANQTGLMQNILQKKLDQDKLTLKNYAASRAALLSGKGDGIGFGMPSAPGKSASTAHGLGPLLTLHAPSDKEIEKMMKAANMKIKQVADRHPIDVKLHMHALAVPKQMQTIANAATKTASTIQGALGHAFDSIAQRGATLKSVLHGFFASLEQDASQGLAKMIMSGVMGGSSGGAAGSQGSSAIMSIFGSLFGGGKAAGGSVSAGHLYQVNEGSGVELFMPHTDGTIVPHNQTRTGPTTNHHNVNIDARGAGPDEVAKLESMRQQIIAQMRGETEYRLNRNAWMNS